MKTCERPDTIPDPPTAHAIDRRRADTEPSLPPTFVEPDFGGHDSDTVPEQGFRVEDTAVDP